MAVFRIRKRAQGGFTIVGSLGDNRNLVSREVRQVATLDDAAEAISEIAKGFERIRKGPAGAAG